MMEVFSLEWLSEALARLVARSHWDWATLEMWASIAFSLACILAVFASGIYVLARRLRRDSGPRLSYSQVKQTSPDGN